MRCTVLDGCRQKSRGGKKNREGERMLSMPRPSDQNVHHGLNKTELGAGFFFFFFFFWFFWLCWPARGAHRSLYGSNDDNSPTMICVKLISVRESGVEI